MAITVGVCWGQPRPPSQGSRVPALPNLGILLSLCLHTLTQNDQIFYMHFYNMAPLLSLWAPKYLAPPSRPRLQSADRNVAVGSHGQYVLTLTAAAVCRVNAAVS